MKKIDKSNIILLILFILGVSLLLYPTIADLYNSYHQTRMIANYENKMNEMDEEEYNKFLYEAKAFNEKLLDVSNRWHLSDEMMREYQNTLNVDGLGMIGYLEIPSLNQKMSIFHGTNESVLQDAIGHLEGSSLPYNEGSNHVVLSAHRGLPSAKLFTNLDRLEVGDIFIVTVLNEIYTYEVDQILIVLPQEMNALDIEEEKQYCTLLTCTPYGINSHRLLVRGKLVDNNTTISITNEAMQIEPTLIAIYIAIPIVIITMFALIIFSSRRKKGIR